MAVKKSSLTVQEIRAKMDEVLALDPELDGVDLRVFLYLCSRVGFQEYVHIPQLELATVLGRRKEHISRSVRKLLDRGLILQSDERVRSSKWRLNPDYGK